MFIATGDIILKHFRNLKDAGEAGNQTWMGYFGKALMTPTHYLPSQMTEVFTQGRAFAVAKLPNAGLAKFVVNLIFMSIVYFSLFH